MFSKVNVAVYIALLGIRFAYYVSVAFQLNSVTLATVWPAPAPTVVYLKVTVYRLT